MYVISQRHGTVSWGTCMISHQGFDQTSSSQTTCNTFAEAYIPSAASDGSLRTATQSLSADFRNRWPFRRCLIERIPGDRQTSSAYSESFRFPSEVLSRSSVCVPRRVACPFQTRRILSAKGPKIHQLRRVFSTIVQSCPVGSNFPG